MSRPIQIVFFIVALLQPVVGQAALPASIDGQPLPSLAPILEQVMPAVVNVHSSTTVRNRHPLANDPFFGRFFGLPRDRVAQSLGSGVIVDAEAGLVLTNNHVIEGADQIRVTLADGATLEAELIGNDPDTDLAVIRIENPPALTALPLPGADSLRVGDFVVAVGNPFGLGQTVTSGIVSALGRRGLRGLNYQNFIQTDASINPGNSGGALINLRGELVGINTAIFSPSGGNVGIGFAIPASIARYVMNELVAHGLVRRGRLGLQVQDLTPRLAEALETDVSAGAVVARVLRDTAADEAGLAPGDVVVAVNGVRVASAADFANAEGLLEVGQPARIDIWRDGKRLTLSANVTAVDPERVHGAALHPRLAGSTLAELESEVEVRSDIDGVLILAVERGSAAARLGLRRGDLILSAGRRDVSSIGELREQLAGRDRVLLNVLRGRQAYAVVLE